MKLEYTLNEIDEVAEELLKKIKNKIWLFDAEMGIGKTTLINSICKKLGILKNISSPTFSIINDYSTESFHIFHFDLYRLKNEEELMDIGFEEYLEQDAYIFIEWPKLAKSFLSEDDVAYISMSQKYDKRILEV